MTDAVIEVLVTIGNAKKEKEICEPNIIQPMELESWMVRRTLKALELFEDEWELSQNKGGRQNNANNSIS